MDQAERPASDNAITSTLHSLAPVLRRYHRSSTKQTVSSGGPQQSSLTEGKKTIIWSKQLLAAEWCVIVEEHVIIFSPPWPRFAACFEMAVAQNGRSVGLFLKLKCKLCIGAPAFAHMLILVIIYLTFL